MGVGSLRKQRLAGVLYIVTFSIVGGIIICRIVDLE